MSETPKLGDRVRVTYEGTAVNAGFGGIHLPGSLDLQGVLADVEILERADDPSKDPVGTLRKSSSRLFVKTGHQVYPWYALGDRLGGEHNANMVDWPVIGVVPGSPADKPKAEPETEYYHGQHLCYRVRGDDAEYWDTSSLVWRSAIVEASVVRGYRRINLDPSDGR